MRKRIPEMTLLCGLMALMLCPATYAQTTGATPASASAWQFDVAPFYLWLPALEGDATARGNEASVDSSFTWTLIGALHYHVSRVVSLVAAYRVSDIDYDEGSDTSRFDYDVLAHGPAFGVVFHF